VTTEKITLNEENIGADATAEQARTMITALNNMGYCVQYGPSEDTLEEPELNSINDADWGRALASIK